MSPPGTPRRRSRLAAVDVAREAGVSISRRIGRSVLTALGTVVGVGAFVATTGLASTARAQVGESFDRLKATEVRLKDANPDGSNPFPADADQRISQLNGVVHGGVLWAVNEQGLDVRATATPSRQPSNIPVIAATPGAVLAARPTLRGGVLLDRFHNDRGERVAIVGRAAADQLGITRIDIQPAVFIRDTAYTVIGIIDDVERSPDILLGVVIPATTATALFPRSQAEFGMLVDVQPGAAEVVGSQAAVAVRPNGPERLQVLVPPDPKTLRRSVEGDVTSLLYGLAGLALLVGAIGIANTTLVAVLERRNEIGVRRALGARRRHIAEQFLAESSTLGLLGGITGTALGIIAITAVSAARHWTTTIDPRFVILAPIIGAVTGLLAGLQPAWRAARITPADALRS